MGVERALFVTNMYPSQARPAYGIFVQRIAHAMEARGVEVRVEQIHGDSNRGDYYFARSRVAEACNTFRPNVVHVHFGWSFLAAATRAPRVVSFYGDDLNGIVRAPGRFSALGHVGIGISQLAAVRCERSVAVSEALRKRIWSSRARRNCTVVRDAVDQQLFTPGDRTTARRRLGITDDRLRVLFPHSLAQATKRLDLAVAAIAALVEGGTHAELWIVNAALPGEMPEYYRAADALIVTSETEGGPSCVKEAMACGLPVVSVPVGDVATIAEAPGRAFIAPRDPRALANAIEAAIDVGKKDRSAYLPEYLTLGSASRRLLRVYDEAIAARLTASRQR
jgi:glycosyltransferase involved in cell wall biosynthesis